MNTPHDKYFRAVMQNLSIAREFLEWFLPAHLLKILDLNTLHLSDATYVDKSLEKLISDVVFNCQYKKQYQPQSQTKNGQNKKPHTSKIIILIEHQSSPHRFMPIRIYNYLFSLLNKQIQSEENTQNHNLLPAIYPMMFYHGKKEDYPYPLDVIGCLENPANIMQDFADLKVQLINVNKLNQQTMNEHGLAGIMTEAMRRIPSNETERNYISVFSRLGHIAQSTNIPDGFTKSTVRYMINVKSVENLKSLIETSNEVPNKLKGEIMTTAEYLKRDGALENSIKIAINMLKEGSDKAFVSKTTELDMKKVEELSKQLDT